MADEKNLNEIYEDVEMNWQEGTEAQYAQYWIVNIDDETLNKINDEGMDFEEEWFKEQESEAEYFCIKFYKALSFLLFRDAEGFGVTGSPIETGYEDADYIYPSLIENDELPREIKALENINVEELEKNFDPKKFRKRKIYPNIWDLHTKEEWFKTLISKYYGLLDFYRKARDKKAHVIIGTYGRDECENYIDGDGDCSNCEIYGDYPDDCDLFRLLTENYDYEEGEVYGTVLVRCHGKAEHLTISESITSIRDFAFDGCSDLTSITVDIRNTAYSSEEGVLFNKDRTVLIKYPAGKQDKNYHIPEGVTSIGEAAFDGCTSLTSITIPSSVTSIGDRAFAGCSNLVTVVVSRKATIGNRAFPDSAQITYSD